MPRNVPEAEGFSGRNDALIAAALVALSAVCIYPLLHVGWVPSDEGTLAASALRVYNGQLPHRDFAEAYTGGLSFYHALAFRLFGVNLFSLRLAVFGVFLLWVPAVYFIARRFIRPLAAFAVTATAIVWSYPNYVAAMPSWYNLFFATFGSAAVLRFLDTRKRRWLIVAGVCGGISMAVKITGLYFLAAVVFFVLYCGDTQVKSIPARRSKLTSVFGTVTFALFLVALTRLLWPQKSAGAFFDFLLPCVCCAAIILRRAWATPSAGSAVTASARASTALEVCGPVAFILCGAALPLALFAAPYLWTHSAGTFLHAMFLTTTTRLGDISGRQRAPGLRYAVYGAVTGALLLLAQERRKRWLNILVVAGLSAVLLISISASGLQDTWYMAGTFTPVLAVIAAWKFWKRNPNTDLMDMQSTKSGHDSATVLLIFVACFCSLVQYPVSYVTYFCYTAPLTLLAATALFTLRPRRDGHVLAGVLLGFFFLFGACALLPKHIFNPNIDTRALHPLQAPRAGSLRVDATTPDYDELVSFLQSHSSNGLLYAANDSPQLYFLTGLTDPTRDDTGATPQEVRRVLQTGDLRLVALNDAPFFKSSVISVDLRRDIARSLPNSRKIGAYTVYWR